MKVFISWSGELSRQLAVALKELIADVIQRSEPFMSQADIEAGASWPIRLNEELKSTAFGVICLTPDNLESRWIHYEAGALAKSVLQAHVCPCLYEVAKSDVKWPLAQFQANIADKDGIFAILRSINSAIKEGSLEQERLIRIFDKHWPDAEATIKGIVAPTDQPTHRSERELLEEILSLVRPQRPQMPQGWFFRHGYPSEPGGADVLETVQPPQPLTGKPRLQMLALAVPFEKAIREARARRDFNSARSEVDDLGTKLRRIFDDDSELPLATRESIEAISSELHVITALEESLLFWDSCESVGEILLQIAGKQ